VPTVAASSSLCKLIDSASTAAVYHDKQLAAAMIAPHGPTPPPDADMGHWSKYLHHTINGNLPAHEARLPLFVYPHDVIRYHLETIGGSLAHRLASGRFREVGEGVFAADGAKLGQYVVTDTSKGPVLLDEQAEVGPHCFLRGPAYLGPRARVIEHSAIKDAVALGHTTKIGGEIEASIVEPYTNKQHHGFLGHSYLGSWINLGAGTSNSDLKNTYGTVKMDYRGEQVPTGMQFVGCVMGDYAKTAINTGIFTGKTIGCCSMVYGFVTTNVPSFVNYARLFGQVTELPPEVMVATQQRMFGRRSVQQRQCDIDLVHAMYDLTRHERQLAGEPLAL
jgi:glucose-1-phosphate thymidylyltransferase